MIAVQLSRWYNIHVIKKILLGFTLVVVIVIGLMYVKWDNRDPDGAKLAISQATGISFEVPNKFNWIGGDWCLAKRSCDKHLYIYGSGATQQRISYSFRNDNGGGAIEPNSIVRRYISKDSDMVWFRAGNNPYDDKKYCTLNDINTETHCLSTSDNLAIETVLDSFKYIK